MNPDLYGQLRVTLINLFQALADNPIHCEGAKSAFLHAVDVARTLPNDSDNLDTWLRHNQEILDRAWSRKP